MIFTFTVYNLHECRSLEASGRQLCFMKGDYSYYISEHYLNENYPDEIAENNWRRMLPALLIDICYRNAPNMGIVTYLDDEEVQELKGLLKIFPPKKTKQIGTTYLLMQHLHFFRFG